MFSHICKIQALGQMGPNIAKLYTQTTIVFVFRGDYAMTMHMTRIQNLARFASSVLTAALAIFLFNACGASSFSGQDEIQSPKANAASGADANSQGSQGKPGSINSLNNPLFQSGAQSNNPDEANSVEQFNGLSLFNVKRMCSNRQTKSIGTNLVSATAGILLKFKPIGPSAGAADISITDTTGLREQIINSARFEIQLSKYNIPDGVYNIQVCDSRYPDTCGNGKGTLGAFTDVKVEKSSASVPSPATILANANIKDTQMRQNYLNMFTSVMSGQQPDPATVFGAFAKNLDMNDLPQECDQAMSPLILDLAGKGIALTAPLAGPGFDINADGIVDQISWPVGNDALTPAFLAIDLNRNGSIDNGSELFGNATVIESEGAKRAGNGFLALSQYDTTNDGVIDSRDAAFGDLLLWQDKNSDGISSADELTHLTEKAVDSINLQYQNVSEIDQFQNETRQRSTATMTSGTVRDIADIWFRLAY